MVHKVKDKNTESKNALKTENKNVQKNMGSKTAHKNIPQEKYNKRTQRYWFIFCSTYWNGRFIRMALFLRSDISGDDITDTNNC